MNMQLIEMTEELRERANDPELVAKLPAQIAESDPACIPILAASLTLASELAVLSFGTLGALLLHVPPEVRRQVEATFSANQQIAELVKRGQTL